MKSLLNVSAQLRVGLLINPYAGLGGPLALKGSDHVSEELRQAALISVEQGQSRAQQRCATFLTATHDLPLHWITVSGAMGQNSLIGSHAEILDFQANTPSTAEDTQRAAALLLQAGLDLLIFLGGDGTARDVCSVIGDRLPVLGVPAGVKMHSGVFAINPQAAADLLRSLCAGELVAMELAEVRDIDELALVGGRVRAQHFGDMRVPMSDSHVQQVKCSGREDEGLVQAEIAAGIVEMMQPGHHYALGAGTTVAAVMAALQLPNTLLGFDIVCDGRCVASDVSAAALEQWAARIELTVIITPTGGQGSLIGRGNQQLSPTLLHRLGRDQIWVLATRSKLSALTGRPLRLDTGDADLDRAWSGWWPVHSGYQQQLLYAVQG
ncbi:MAG: ATP-NAD kinase family protein [Pseudomonadota bacterium]